MPRSPASAPAWVEAALARPVAFAQVREDAALDLEVLAACPEAARVAMIASGGCTAAALAANARTGFLLLVDANESQLELTRLKLALLKEEPAARARLLGHALMESGERTRALGGLMEREGVEPSSLGPVEDGLDFCGRYEAVFRRLADSLGRGGPEALGAACAEAFALPALTALFGPAAVSRAARPFAEHFTIRLLAASARPGSAANPYLSLMTRSRLPPGGALPWMLLPGRSAPPAVEYHHGGMREALEKRPGEFDFVHLSNIFDWLPPLERTALLDAARRALKPGGWVLARRLNSDFAPDGGGFVWHDDRAERMTAEDRSAIYSALHLGRKR